MAKVKHNSIEKLRNYNEMICFYPNQLDANRTCPDEAPAVIQVKENRVPGRVTAL